MNHFTEFLKSAAVLIGSMLLICIIIYYGTL